MGFDKWNKKIHYENEQLKRICSAKKIPDNNIIDVDTENKTCVIQGNRGIYEVSLEKCNCFDFSQRKLPCKHMYWLADILGELDNLVGLDTAIGEYRLQHENNVQLIFESNTKNEQFDMYGMFGCCSLFRECSFAGHCLQDDEYYKSCAYRAHLEKEKIFYTEKSEYFSQERYDYIVNFRNSLYEEEKNTFDEIVIYFEKTKRCCKRCFCLFSPLVNDIVEKCDAFVLLPPEELIKQIFNTELILNTRAEEFHKKYSKLPAPTLKPPLPKLSETATEKEKKIRKMENDKINAENLKTWEKHYLSDPDLQKVLSKTFLYFEQTKKQEQEQQVKYKYSFELDEFFNRNYDVIVKKTDYLVFYESKIAKIFREKIV